MILYSEALSILREAAGRRSLGAETLPLLNCMGRIASEPVASPEDVPSFNNSAMDGFAVCAEALASASKSNPVRLKVLGTIMAGNRPPRSSQPPKHDECWEIMTGAPMPQGPQDSVIKVEEVEVVRAADGQALEVLIRRPIEKEENVREQGEDFKTGQKVLEAGARLCPEHVLALSSLGITRLKVRARPRIAVISTGDELVPAETPTLEPGMIRNSTGPYLESAIPAYGAEARFHGTVSDSPGAFLKLMEKVLSDSPDVVLTTGAVSMGKHDFIPSALADLRAEIRYHKVAIRPGKPGLFAELPGGPVIFGSPGNPISTAVALRFFLWPYLQALSGLPAEEPLTALLSNESAKPKGLRCFFKARVDARPDGVRVRALKGQPSFMVSPLLQSNAWVIFPEEGESVAEGSEVKIYPLYPDLSGRGGLPL